MPTYDYVCGACGHRIEVVHAIHADGPQQCPNCHAHALRKAFAPPAIVFKGSGWAKKDRGHGAAKGAKAGEPSGAGASSDASGTSASGSGSDAGSGTPSGSSDGAPATAKGSSAPQSGSAAAD